MMRRAVVLSLGLGLTILIGAQPVWSVVFRCVDSSGNSIFTDSPTQLGGCTVIHRGTPEPAIRSVPPSTSLDRSLASPNLDSSPSEDHLFTSPSNSRPNLNKGARTVTVPVYRAGRSLVVIARLNGERDARLIVDTGAEITVLSHEIVRDLGIVPTSSSRTITLNTVGGTVRADMVRVDQVTVGGLEVRHVTAAVHDLPEAPSGVEGLLGLSFLEHFLVTLDAREGKLYLSPRR